MQGFDFDKDLYFTSKEFTAVKKSLTAFSHSMTAVKADIEGIKAAVSIVAATAQFLKVDYSLWKLDEKGITFRGVQKVTWKNVQDAEKTKATAKQKEMDERLKTMFLARGAGKGIKEAKKAADKANKGVQELRNKLRSAGQGAMFEPTKDKRQELNRLRNSARALSETLAGI
ncbi:hypothetical protein ACFRQM_34095 [Streptomyces sp. NPDC056831]|uniref:hypothetical protein n=1 Tax=Streptomyces sp. NPDC056831 TaxID=3345954 RepID=UPI0036B3BF94